MENCSGDRRCLICRRLTQENSSTKSEKLVSNATLLQDFLNCFHINVLDSIVNDLSTSCKFCPTCEQFISEWSSIQTQMTKLIRRASQLKATLSSLLLSAPQIQEQKHNEDATEIMNTKIQNSREVQLPLLLQEIVDDIRNELRRKYLVNVIVDKSQLPSPPRNLNQEEIPSLSGHYDLDEPMDVSKGNDNSDGNSQTSSSPEIKKKRRATYAILTPDGPNRFKYKGISIQRNVEDQTYSCVACGFKSRPNFASIRSHINNRFKHKLKSTKKKKIQPAFIRVGPNRFKYNGYDIWLNDEDHFYYCGVCNYKGHTTVPSTIDHIKKLHYTAEDRLKFTAVKTSNDEWLYAGKYKIVRVDEKFRCAACGSVKSSLRHLVTHLQVQHVDVEESDESVPLPKTDPPSVKDSAEDSVQVISDNIPLASEVKLEPLPVDCDSVEERWDHWECAANIQIPFIPKIEPLSGDDDEPSDDEEFRAHNSDEEYLARENELNDMETPEQLLEVRPKSEGGEICDYSQDSVSRDSVDSKEMNLKAGSYKTNRGPGKRQVPPVVHTPGSECNITVATPAEIDGISGCAVVYPYWTNRFKYNGYDVRLNDQDKCYYCGVCNFNGGRGLGRVLGHIKGKHYTADDIIKFSTVQISDNEWLYGGKYKIIKVDEKKFKCASCKTVKSSLHELVSHTRTQHVDLASPDKVVPLPVTDTSSANDLTSIPGEIQSVPYTFNPADNKYTCGLCESQVSTWIDLGSHIRQRHMAPPEKLPCGFCGAKLSDKRDYQMHLLNHQSAPNKSMQCPTCYKQFREEWSLKTHRKLWSH